MHVGMAAIENQIAAKRLNAGAEELPVSTGGRR
jgi:hypothetical protein